MRILIVSQYFWPENFRINDLALELKMRGNDITVLTGLPNYPMGDYFEGYSIDKNHDEIWEGISIYRCKLRARKLGTLNLIKNYFSFVIQGKRKIREFLDEEFDLIYIFGLSPITVALPAIYIKRKRKIPIIMNVQDLWPENIIAVSGIQNKYIIQLTIILVKYIYRHCDLILAASKSFVPAIQKRTKIKDKVKYWPQYATVSKEKIYKKLFNPNHFNIVFTGNIGKAQGLDIVLEAALILKNTTVCWHLIGEGCELNKLKTLVVEKGLQDKVIFHGQKPEIDIPQYLANADAALLILKPDPIFDMTLPAKLQTYMACGKPIIGCISGEGKKVIEEAQCGITCENVSSEELSKICKRFLKMADFEYEKFCNNALEYSKKYFNKHTLIDYLELLMKTSAKNSYKNN